LAHCATCLSSDLLYQLSPVVRRSLSILATCGPRALVLVVADKVSINQWLVQLFESHVQMCTTDTLRLDRAGRPLRFGEQPLPRALGTGTMNKKPPAPATRAGLFGTARVSIQVPRCMLFFCPSLDDAPRPLSLCSLFSVQVPGSGPVQEVRNISPGPGPRRSRRVSRYRQLPPCLYAPLMRASAPSHNHPRA